MPERIERNNKSEQPKPMQLEKAIAEVLGNVFNSHKDDLRDVYAANLNSFKDDPATINAYNTPIPVRETLS